MERSFDVLIVGTGMGGATLAWALRGSGARVVLLDRGGHLPREAENWSPAHVIGKQRYAPGEQWINQETGQPFAPATYYFVGGNTKLYGAALVRFRERDFEALEHLEGTSPAWPISYADLAPFYAQAEALYGVRGRAGDDPCEPPRDAYQFGPVAHEPYAARLVAQLQGLGLRPFHLPLAIGLGDGGGCIRCATCDGFPCKLHAKGDAETCAVGPALQDPNITLRTHTRALRLITDQLGRRITGVEVETGGVKETLRADTVVVACGAANSAALLLRSTSALHPDGLANASGLVGRNYMAHINSIMLAVDPTRTNDDVFQKTIALNDFYFGSDTFRYPMGNMQILGKLQAEGYIAYAHPQLGTELRAKMVAHSVDWYVMSEDLPDPDNRVTLGAGGGIRVQRKFKNMQTHTQLMSHARRVMRELGYVDFHDGLLPIETNSHQCGTLRFGRDPQLSVLDPLCRSWQHDNLYVVDASFFPSSAALNPALTIAAQALRVGQYLRGAHG